MPVWKIFACEKELVLSISGIKEFHLSKRKLHLNKKGNSTFAKNLLHHINRADWSFIPYDLATVNDCLSDTLEKAKSGANSSLQTTCEDNLSKLISWYN